MTRLALVSTFVILSTFSLYALAPLAAATPPIHEPVCTDALTPNDCSLEILCVYEPNGQVVKCVKDPCWNAAVC